MTINIAKLLDRKEYDVRFAVIGRSIDEIKEFIPNGYPIELIRIRNILDFTTLRIYRYLKRMKAQYVFSSLHYLNPRVIQAAKWVGGCKIVVRLNCEVSRLDRINLLLTQITYPKADVIICQTEVMRNELMAAISVPKDKVIALHNLIDMDYIDAKIKATENPYMSEHRKIFVWVGRFDPVKGADIVIKAFSQALHEDDNICLYMVGKTDERNKYYQGVRRFVLDNRLCDNVVFLGFQKNPYQWMKYANCFVLSSRSEGSPNALFEALYLNVPAVATRCTPNIEDIINNGVNGYIVPKEDTEAMAEGMIRALKIKRGTSIYKHSSPDEFRNIFV